MLSLEVKWENMPNETEGVAQIKIKYSLARSVWAIGGRGPASDLPFPAKQTGKSRLFGRCVFLFHSIRAASKWRRVLMGLRRDDRWGNGLVRGMRLAGERAGQNLGLVLLMMLMTGAIDGRICRSLMVGLELPGLEGQLALGVVLCLQSLLVPRGSMLPRKQVASYRSNLTRRLGKGRSGGG